jgi:sugar phosphate isomerase/epimerase
MTQSLAPFGVASYSFPVSCGYAQRKDKSNLANPMKAYALADLAAQHNLSSLEIPLDAMLPDLSHQTIDAFKAHLDAHHLKLLVDTGVVDVDNLTKLLPLAKRAGASVVRAVVSGILEGNRNAISKNSDMLSSGWGRAAHGEAKAAAPGWPEYLAEIRRRLIDLLPVLKDLNLVLALENHQDCTSDELLAFCEIDPDHIGVTLDVVNPMAVCEEPYAFANKVGPHIRDIHIKDYTVRSTPQGYRLVRAAIGQGVIDWPRMLALLREVAPNAALHIELAAIYARHIRVFEDEWWSSFPPRAMSEVVPALRFMQQHAVPDGVPWRTPWEDDGDDAPEAANRYEMAQFAHSVQYLKMIV